MPIKLWLDDERDPTDKYIQEDFGADGSEIWVKTVDAAIAYLKTNDVISISFDHDLGTKQTGYDLAKWIEERAAYGKISSLIWNVHSYNIVGSQKIVQAMLNADGFWKKES